MVLPQGSARPPACNLPRKNVPIPHLESTSTVPTVRRIGWTRQRPLSPQRKFSVPSVFLTRPPEKAKRSFTLKKWRNGPNGHLRHNPLSRPIHEIVHAAHAKVHEVEQENVGVEAGHKGEVLTERGLAYGKGKVRAAVHHHRTKPWRDAAKAEQASLRQTPNTFTKRHCMMILHWQLLTRYLAFCRNSGSSGTMQRSCGRQRKPQRTQRPRQKVRHRKQRTHSRKLSLHQAS